MRLLPVLVLLVASVAAQDSSLASLRVVVSDPSGARVRHATVTIASSQTNAVRTCDTDTQGRCTLAGLDSGGYQVEVSATGFQPTTRTIELSVADALELAIALQVGSARENVTVSAQPIELEPSGIASLVTQKEIEELPLNGRRFADLALLDSNAVQDPRSLVSSSNGDLAFGGIRGGNTTYVVDGMDNNNGFFAQARGRLRSPYQFSNETIKEFRVSTNTFGVEQGRSSGAVVNVITKSGTNTHHGSIFYYLRDGQFAATHPFVRKKYPDKQHQFGGVLGGPIRKDKIFYSIGFDQHIFHVPTVVQFDGGAPAVVPTMADYESTDQALVMAKAAQLSALGGQFRSVLNGNAGFAKLDFQLSPRHKLTTRLSTSHYYGENNVFFDGVSPITNFGVSGNGEENVTTTTFTASLNSTFGTKWTSNARFQFSKDDESSRANTTEVATKISDIIEGFGRSSILPRSTDEDRVQVAETVGWISSHHAVKLGADLYFTKTDNYFPRLFGGEYIFDDIKVNPFTFVPQLAGLPLTPLRAYAHSVPRYYIQDFGSATTHPDTNEYALFVQDTLRLGDHLALSLGMRYDRQTFRQPNLPENPLWPDAGRMPSDGNNFAPRIGIAASFGDRSEPFVLRGGFGIFYPRIPQIYNSWVEAENGTRSHLFLDNSNSTQRPFFPAYPNPLADCAVGSETCVAPANVAPFLTTDVSSFDRNFKSPYVQQASLSLEKQVAPRTSVTASYLFVGGRHLLRSRDVNLPQPTIESYPIFDETGTTFTGDYYSVASFGTWQTLASLTCPFPPCMNDVVRPNPALGAVNVFETAARSTYHGFTLSTQKRWSHGFTARIGYTWAKAIDDTQDSLVAGRPSVVENSFSTKNERALSVTDQRHRFVSSFVSEPNPFGTDHALLAHLFNDWKFSGIFSAGTGRPLSGRITGDANRDGNDVNDRLPGASRNSFTGPDYISGEARLTRRFYLAEQWRLEATAEAFNVFNRNNQRVDTTDDGFTSIAASFVPFDSTVAGTKYPAQFRQSTGFLVPTDAYAPRQVQFSLRLKW